MASSKPPQERMVDPFASYNSNEVNRLTEIVGLGRNGIIGYPSLQISANDPTSVIVARGYILKDDVLIFVSESTHVVDFLDPDHYIDSTPPIPEVGYHYIVFDYTYVKSRPAPEASIKILKPSETYLYTSASNLHLLKVVQIIEPTPNNYEISQILDYDPLLPDNQRRTILSYAGARFDIPVHSSRYQGNFLYSSDEDDFVFGLSNRWVKLQESTSLAKDTSALAKGDLVYFNSTSGVDKALSSPVAKTADGVVVSVGNSGRVQTTGYVEDVPIESGAVVNIGDLMYLSFTEAGKVTNIESYPAPQFVGRCIAKTATTCTLLFVRGYATSSVAAATASGFSETLLAGNWNYDGGLNAYYQDIDTSILDGHNAVVSARDTTSDIIIEPLLFDFLEPAATLRVWMPDSTTELDITLIGRKIGTTPGDTIEVVRNTLAAGGSWNAVGSRYYQDVNIATIGTKSVVVEVWDGSDLMKIRADSIELVDANTLRIWMTDNTHTLHVTAMGPKVTTNTYMTVITTLPNTAWTLSAGSYYQDVGMAVINNQDVTVNVKDTSTGEKIYSEDVEFRNVASVRIWMPDDTKTLEVLVVG